MSTVADLARHLESLVALDKAGGWDPVGLQVGDDAADVGSIAVCHETTHEVVAAIERETVDLLVTYHPLLFRATRRFVAGRDAAGRAFRLARAGTALLVVHTAFDVAPGGVADSLAATLGLLETRPLGPNWGPDSVKVVTFVPGGSVDEVADAMSAAGAGKIGRYTGCSYRIDGLGAFTPSPHASPRAGTVGTANVEPEVRIEMVAPAGLADRVVAALVAHHPYEEPAYDVYDVRSNAGFVGRHGTVAATSLRHLAERAATALACVPRVAGHLDSFVERVAVVPGSGGSFIPAAAAVADVLVTGDISHHEARDALDRGLALIDVGHVAGERPGVKALYSAVAQLGVTAHSLLDLDPDPWS